MNIPLPFIAYSAVGLAGALFFWRNRNAALKRLIWPFYMIGAALLFVAILTDQSKAAPPTVLIVLVIVITVLNIRGVRFCDGCGATIRAPSPFRAPVVCPECSKSLDATTKV